MSEQNSAHSKPVPLDCALGAQGLAEECVLKNCDTCKYYGQDEEDYPCIRCDYADRWEIAPDLVRP